MEIWELPSGVFYRGVSFSMKLLSVERHGKMGAPQYLFCDANCLLLCVVRFTWF